MTPADAVAGYVPTKFDGIDYWAISFTHSQTQQTDKKALHRMRYSFINQILTQMKQDGRIVDPDGLRDGLDFTTSLNRNNASNPNYVYNRGFIEWIDEDMRKGSMWSISTSYYRAPNYNSGGHYVDFFLSYVRAAMTYSREAFYKEYPKEKYPLVAERFELAISYMKEKHGVDLQAIALGFQSEDTEDSEK